METWKIAPNPTDGMVTVSGGMLQKVKVYNIVGQLVAEKQTEGETMTMDLSQLPSGLYFLDMIHQNGSTCMRKLLKQ